MTSQTNTTVTTHNSSRLKVVSSGNKGEFQDDLIYETIALGDCHYDKDQKIFYYMCPCGDLFEFSLGQLLDGNLVSECPSCSLRVRIDLKDGDLEPYM
ncbi:CSL zinc finger domain containing protein [Babesia bovis T2Bo]|uniref:CSL zinc finger domain containing protein n=1 Tax=Babesia bovis TaxID=5865 RepID=A7AWW0_BABBO|nr:CSL zinc finger domain containing protein [Babesia bovis T2Bo]EDO05538.1 CSL zinc finger domain containing protein [Babesia bovis T2Bo]|eukprot:XP_001609106.1 CSL zinc finger domain containing protein [Babesia bovis T2Bo]